VTISGGLLSAEAATLTGALNGTSASFVSGQFNPYTTAGSNASPVFQDALIIGTSTNACKIQYGNEFTSTNGSYLRFVVNGAASQNNPVNALTINPSGNVGVGTTPVVRFQVQDSANTYVSHFSGLNQTNGIALGTNSSNAAIIQGYTRTFSATNNISMQVDGGNVGIGTASPGQKLAVSDSGGVTRVLVENTGNAAAGAGLQMLVSSSGTTVGNGTIRTDNADNMQFFNIGGERMRITSGGALQMSNNATTFSIGSISGQNRIQWDSTEFAFLNTANSYTALGASAFNTRSDYRLKENVAPVQDALSKITSLKPCTFNFIAEPEKEVVGFIAHEVQEVFPQAISGEKDGFRIEQVEVSPAELDEEGNVITESVIEEKEVPVYQGIDHSKLVPLLVAAIQEQQEQIKSLTEQVEALKSQING
jgi:hypothetical protein